MLLCCRSGRPSCAGEDRAQPRRAHSGAAQRRLLHPARHPAGHPPPRGGGRWYAPSPAAARCLSLPLALASSVGLLLRPGVLRCCRLCGRCGLPGAACRYQRAPQRPCARQLCGRPAAAAGGPARDRAGETGAAPHVRALFNDVRDQCGAMASVIGSLIHICGPLHDAGRLL